MQDSHYLPAPPVPSHSRSNSRPSSFYQAPPKTYQEPRVLHNQPAPAPSTHRYSISSQSPPHLQPEQYQGRPRTPHSRQSSAHGTSPQHTPTLSQPNLLDNPVQTRQPSHHTPLHSYTVPNDSPTDTRPAKPILPPISPVSLSSASPYTQFCNLTGIPAPPPSHPFYPAWKSTLYARVTRRYQQKQWEYWFTASVGNFLLLIQILMAAVITALGATRSPHISITVLGAISTVVAGLITYLKSRGQPMRARTFRDKLEECVNAIQDAEAMFLGVSEGVNGYDVEDGESGIEGTHDVTVREEVERLTKMYESAVKQSQQNYPDLWSAPPDGALAKKGEKIRGKKGGWKSSAAGTGRMLHATGIKM